MTRALTLLALAAMATAAASCRPYSADEGDAPEQPIAFYHSVHAGQNQIECMYCHYTADRSPSAGIPSVQLCVGCHVAGGTAEGANRTAAQLAFPAADRDSLWNAEATKLVEYWQRGEAIPWVRIHKLPEHAKFPHSAHVDVGLQCQTCHGPVQEMDEIYQFSSLRMGWCIECHRGERELSEEEEASIDARSSFRRHLREMRARGGTEAVAGVTATYPNQRASVDCTVCHY